MTLLKAVLLGIIQGLTEFLPISSSGHLVIFQNLFGLHEPQLVFDIMVHLGTLLAIFVVFFEDIVQMIKESSFFITGLLKKKEPESTGENLEHVKLLKLIIIGTIPTALIGYLIEKKAESIFSSLTLVGAMLMLTGLLLWLTKRFSNDRKDIKKMGIKDALTIGIVQGMAVLPGISRSGSTISVGLFLGLNRSLAARFSFLLFIPAIMGALLLKSEELVSLDYFSLIPNIAGMMAAFITGYFSLRFLMRIVMKGNLYLFAYYCLLIGLLTLILPFFVPASPFAF